VPGLGALPCCRSPKQDWLQVTVGQMGDRTSWSGLGEKQSLHCQFQVEGVLPPHPASESENTLPFKATIEQSRPVRVSVDSPWQAPYPLPLHLAWEGFPAQVLRQGQEDWQSLLSPDALLDSSQWQVAESTISLAFVSPRSYCSQTLSLPCREGQPRCQEIWWQLWSVGHLLAESARSSKTD